MEKRLQLSVRSSCFSSVLASPLVSPFFVRDKRYWEGKRQTIRQREKHMEETIARYQTEMEELQKSRKEIIRQAKEEAERMLQESNARIENTIRTIKEAQAEKEKTRQALL